MMSPILLVFSWVICVDVESLCLVYLLVCIVVPCHVYVAFLFFIFDVYCWWLVCLSFWVSGCVYCLFFRSAALVVTVNVYL